MRKAWLATALIVALIVGLMPLTVMAGVTEEEDQTVPSHSVVENQSPVIIDNTLRIVIYDDFGDIVFDSQYSWVDTDGDDLGDEPPPENVRPDPYAWESEKVGIYKDVSDTNGQSDIKTMRVEAEVFPYCNTLGAIVAIVPMGLVEYWNNGNGYTGKYYGEFIVPNVINAYGSKGVKITATDEHGGQATPEADCDVYDKDGDGVKDEDLWLNPFIYSEWVPLEIYFPSGMPTDEVTAPTLTLEIWSDVPSGVLIELYIKGTQMVNTGYSADIIPVSNIYWEETTSGNDDTLENGDVLVGEFVIPQDVHLVLEFVFELYYPNVQPGSYEGAINFHVVAG